MTEPFISICIPAYKRIDFLKKALESIRSQSFRNFEVIITDDSPDDSVRQLVNTYGDSLPIQYFKNTVNLGTPENWNEGMRHAKGKWIKLMHDDDWFATEVSLQKFALAAEQNPASFIFSAFTNHYLDEDRTEEILASEWRLKKLRSAPATLFASNVIGPPSVVMHKNDGRFFYDRNTKWLVDIDFYLRRLANEYFVFINEPLVNVGLSAEQVTQSCFRNPEVEIPEHFHVLKKLSSSIFNDPVVYDAWWRLFRNLKIRSLSDIRKAGYDGEVPQFLQRMINFQKKIPAAVLNKGIVSKPLMFLHYLINKP